MKLLRLLRRGVEALEHANQLKENELEQRERLITSQYEQYITTRNAN